ncbi:class B sortase [Bacillaceae bacterium Marseille-Q3522]|nr:class B sortase [Bacillaceae bacterium Marseille-Q3522]
MVYSLFVIFENVYSYQKSAGKYNEIRKIYGASNDEAGDNKDGAQAELLQQNHDYVGWLKVDGTKIDYPVVKGDDNNFYLTHNFSKEIDFAGAIFMDFRNSGKTLDKHMVLYGHHMKDNSMFGNLENYFEDGFYQNHNIITFDFQGSTYNWEIFSVYTEEDGYLMKTDFRSDDEFTAYVQEIKEKSVISSKTAVTGNDTILSLSTCTNDSENGRIIVHAKLVSS